MVPKSLHPIGRPLAFAADRMVSVAGSSVTADEVHQTYLEWCTVHDYVPLKAGAFRDVLDTVCRSVGIAVATDAGDMVLRDTALRAGGAKG